MTITSRVRVHFKGDKLAVVDRLLPLVDRARIADRLTSANLVDRVRELCRNTSADRLGLIVDIAEANYQAGRDGLRDDHQAREALDPDVNADVAMARAYGVLVTLAKEAAQYLQGDYKAGSAAHDLGGRLAVLARRQLPPQATPPAAPERPGD